MILVHCARCGAPVWRVPSQVKRNNRFFCSRQCHMATLNEELNPHRMTPDVKEKLRAARLNTGEGKTYTKRFSRHEHRVVAEQILGRPLMRGEVVHHIDGDKRNNAPENLMVFPSPAEHVKWHAAHDPSFGRKGGDRNAV